MENVERMLTEIHNKRTNFSGIKSNIERNSESFREFVIKAIYYLPSQSYGLFIKDYIFKEFKAVEFIGADGYTNTIGSFKIKVCVTDSKIAKLKQIKPEENISNYILVFFNHEDRTVKTFKIPSSRVYSFLNTKPDHGSLQRGHSGEFTAHININLILDCEIEIG